MMACSVRLGVVPRTHRRPPHEWDEEKRGVNIKKHGIDFIRAAKIFQNPVLERLDDRDDYREDRMIATGHWQEYFIPTSGFHTP